MRSFSFKLFLLLLCVSANSGLAESIWQHIAEIDNVKLKDIRLLAPGLDESVWFAGDTGLFQYLRGQTKQVSSGFITSIEIDLQGTVWFGGSNGLFRYKNGKNEQMMSGTIAGLDVDNQGMVWITKEKNIQKYSGNEWTTIFSGDKDSTLTFDGFYGAIYATPDGSLWGRTKGESGIWRFQNGTLRVFTAKDGLLDNYNYISFFVSSSDGTIWCAYNNAFDLEEDDRIGGVSRYSGTSWETYTMDNGLPSKEMFCLVAANKNSSFVSTGNGIGLFNGDTWTKISEKYAPVMTFDSQGSLWVFGSSLSKYSNGIWTEYGTNPFPILFPWHSMIVDGRGNVWNGTSDGVIRFSPTTLNVSSPISRPLSLKIEGNYPNPFNQNTFIMVTLSERSTVDLSIYSVTGQCIRKLIGDTLNQGSYKVAWDGKDDRGRLVSSGCYQVLLKNEFARAVHSMTFMK